MFENSVPGLPERAAAEGLTPLEWMRRYGAFEISRGGGARHEQEVPAGELGDPVITPAGRVYNRVSHVALLRAVRGAADRTALEIVQAVPPQRWAAAAQRTVGPPAP